MRVGPLDLRVPRDRDGTFETAVFERYQRSEKALVLAMMEMVVNGVSPGRSNASPMNCVDASFRSPRSAGCVRRSMRRSKHGTTDRLMR